MTERPILFSAEMVRAILKGDKTQTRRAIKPVPTFNGGGACHDADALQQDYVEPYWVFPETCKYGAPGDLLWVRETFCAHWDAPPHDAPQSYRIVTGDELPPIKQESGDLYQPVPSDIMTVWYGAQGDKPFHMAWRPSIHMPRWASRIELLIKDVRVERLQDVSEDDARAEGWPGPITETGFPIASPLAWFANVWTSINGAGAWDANPYVWVIEFERVKP